MGYMGEILRSHGESDGPIEMSDLLFFFYFPSKDNSGIDAKNRVRS